MDKKYQTSDYLARRKRLSGVLFEVALPNEYLVPVGQRSVKPQLGGTQLKLFRRFLRVPASVQTLYFETDNANVDYQGIGIQGYASWRINPAKPEVAISTLDFFDPNDPMARTNEELKTICVEAVRHVISNMSIDDALKKKDEIAENLRSQLKEVESQWGIIFDQVGIEKVRIMSSSLFEQLQSQFRDGLRLDVEKKRISTDREIAKENNTMREKTELETMETNKKLNLVKVENQSQVQETSLAEQFKISQKQRQIDEETFREEAKFTREKETSQHEILMMKKQQEIAQIQLEFQKQKQQRELELLKLEMEIKALEVEKLRREIEQYHTAPALTSAFIENLPEIFDKIKIGQYSVLTGGAGEEISPVGRLVTEIAAMVKATDLANLFVPSSKSPPPQAGKKAGG